MIALKDFAVQYANTGRIKLRVRDRVHDVPTSERRLADFEEMHRVCEMYSWLSGRLGTNANALKADAKFPDVETAISLKARIEEAIEKGLDAMAAADGKKRRKKSARRHRARGGEESRGRMNPEARRRAREIRKMLRLNAGRR